MGVQAVNVGGGDLLMGVAFLQAEGKKLPFLSANLIGSSDRKLLFPPFIVRDVEGVRVGVTGLLSPDWTPAVRRVAGNRVAVLNPAAAAVEAMKGLRDKADVVILLSDLSLPEEAAVVDAVPGIHFVLGGREGRFGTALVGNGDVPRLQSYRQGMYVGRLDMDIVRPGLPILEKNRAQRLESQLNDKESLFRHLKKWDGEDTAPGLLRRIRETEEEIEHLREVLQRTRSVPESGNFYQWLMVPMNTSIAEDRLVREEFAEEKKVPGRSSADFVRTPVSSNSPPASYR
jgi:2',3'-cyclic-nucleotide 2'-phosphodiesterase (5'-nucleotidase family)